MLNNRQRQHRGFTIVEMMVTVVLGLSLMSSVLVGYLGVYKGSLNTFGGSRLGQEANSLMSVMVNEIRRAGYTGQTLTDPSSNSFSQNNSTALAVYNTVASNSKQSGTGSGQCILYAYDMDGDGTVDSNELSGFRLYNGVVQIRTAGNTSSPDTCAASSTGNTWSDLTDSTFMTVTTLTFDLSSSKCLNTRDPDEVDDDTDGTVDDADEADCYAHVPTTSSGNITVETRVVAITLTATLASDSFVRQSLTETVRVRNDYVRVR